MPARRRFFAMVLVVLPVACITPAPSVPGAPDWVRGSDRNFPEQSLLLARASALSESEAQDKARADLARPFVLQVDSASVTATSAGGGHTRRLVALSEKIIEQIRVAARWQDPATRVHHALASLPRDVAADSLREAIRSRDELVHQATRQAEVPGNLLGRLRQLDQAVDKQIEREALNHLRSRVAPDASPMDTPWTVERLRQARDSLFAEVRLSLEIMPGSVEGAGPVLEQVLDRLSLRANSAEEANYRLMVRLVMEEDPSRGERMRQQGILEVTLVDRAGGRILGLRRWLIRAEGPDRAATNRRALEEANHLLFRHLHRFLLESANR